MAGTGGLDLASINVARGREAADTTDSLVFEGMDASEPDATEYGGERATYLHVELTNVNYEPLTTTAYLSDHSEEDAAPMSDWRNPMAIVVVDAS